MNAQLVKPGNILDQNLASCHPRPYAPKVHLAYVIMCVFHSRDTIWPMLGAVIMHHI